MNKAINSFISSTFWTERIGFVAALKSIEFYKKNKIDKVLKKNGKYILLQWKKLSKKYKLNLKINDMYCICKFEFEEKLKYAVNQAYEEAATLAYAPITEDVLTKIDGIGERLEKVSYHTLSKDIAQRVVATQSLIYKIKKASQPSYPESSSG